MSVKVANELLSFFADEVALGRALDPAVHSCNGFWPLFNALGQVSQTPHNRALYEQLYRCWWDLMTRAQLQQGLPAEQCYRAMAGYCIALNRLAAGDTGSALRWAILAHLADATEGHHLGTGGAEHMLRCSLGVPRSVVDRLSEAARAARAQAVTAGWKQRLDVVPEHLLSAALEGSDYRALLAPAQVAEVPLCPAYMTIATDSAINDPSGKALERLASYLVTTLPGWRPRRNVWGDREVCQHDVVAVEVAPTPWRLPDPGRCMLIECKNWSKTVGVGELGYLFARMQLVGSRLGVMMARKGLTGADDDQTGRKNADHLRSRFRDLLGAVCVVIDESDLKTLASGADSFRSMLEHRYEIESIGVSK
ncbi:MAG: hypothetical protein IT379_30000 [Deltaproteobacteria bacterium]|nr:hypothetical protein [Deltaproteobacteria bacterium]